MKKIFITIMLTYLFIPFSYAQESKKIISVTGLGIVEVIPDEVSFSVGVRTENKKVKKAQTANNKQMDIVQNILEKNKIPKKNIRTASYDIFPINTYKDGKAIFVGYSVDNKWTVKLSNIKELSNLIDELSEYSSYVQDIHYSFKDNESIQNEALKKAMDNARQKADFMAQQVNLKVTSIHMIQDDTESVGPYNNPMFALKQDTINTAKSSTVFQTGTIFVQARVKMTFELSN